MDVYERLDIWVSGIVLNPSGKNDNNMIKVADHCASAVRQT